jgi:DNA-binding response OmpR family regulator
MADEQGTIVVIEDDPNIADLLDMYLRREGFRVLQAGDGTYGLELVRRENPRLVILDVGLPGELDGLDVCRRIRGIRDTPVVILTARHDEIDRVLGLELGADDYVTKPFSPRELVARVKAVLRRSGATSGTAPVASSADGRKIPAVLHTGAVEVDPARREVRAAGQEVELTAREFDLLAHFAANSGLVYSRQQLLDAVWGEGWYGDERTVDVHVRQLRKKLGEALPLKTVWGVGYRCG